jgi:diketogulonate reductase-like aldo/keto reductase
LLAESPSIFPIPGTRNETHLLENLGAQGVTLTAEDMQEIATSISKFVVYGDRMGEAHMSQIDYTICCPSSPPPCLDNDGTNVQES